MQHSRDQPFDRLRNQIKVNITQRWCFVLKVNKSINLWVLIANTCVNKKPMNNSIYLYSQCFHLYKCTDIDYPIQWKRNRRIISSNNYAIIFNQRFTYSHFHIIKRCLHFLYSQNYMCISINGFIYYQHCKIKCISQFIYSHNHTVIIE